MLRLALALCLSLAAGQPQIFYSEPEGLAFLPAKSPKLIGADGVTAMLSSLLSIRADSLSHETGSQVTMHSSQRCAFWPACSPGCISCGQSRLLQHAPSDPGCPCCSLQLCCSPTCSPGRVP